MPRPRLEHRAGIRGARSFYPAWAADQLAAIVRLHRRTHRLEELTTALWWEGRWVDSVALRQALVAPFERLSGEIAEARADEEDPYEAADAILRVLPADSKPSEFGAQLRRRLSSSADFMNLMWTFLVLGLGGQAPWEQEDRSRLDPAPTALQLLAKATGVDAAISKDRAERPSWLPEDFDLREPIGDLRDAGAFALEDMARPIREASGQALAQARADALLFVGPLAMMGSVLEEFAGEDVAALGMLHALDPASGFGRAALIQMMLILRKLAGEEAFSSITELVASEYERFAAIADLRAALPQYESLLRADYQERLAELEPQHAEQVRHDVATYLQAHPETADALRAA